MHSILEVSNVTLVILALSNVESTNILKVQNAGCNMSNEQTQEMSMEQMRQSAEQAAGLLKSMSNAHRLLILCHLGDAEQSVSQLNELIDLSQSSLSQHLARLRQDSLVKTRRESQTIYYSIAEPVTMNIIGLLQESYCRVESES